jgi:hypothetical protein
MKYFELTSNYQNCSPHTGFTNSELPFFFIGPIIVMTQKQKQQQIINVLTNSKKSILGIGD